MKTNHFFKEKVIFLIFILAFFSFSLVSAANIGSSDVSGVVITPKLPVIDVNATSVNNSQYLQGYTPTTLGTFLQGLMGWLTKAVADTYYADIKWAYNETYTGGTFNSTYVTNTTANNTYVPYTGASSNVDLGPYSITAGIISDGTAYLTGGRGYFPNGIQGDGGMFSTDGSGTFTASYFVGDGSGLTGIGSTFNSTYNTWSYNQTSGGMNYTNIAMLNQSNNFGMNNITLNTLFSTPIQINTSSATKTGTQQYSTYVPANAFDGNTATYFWRSNAIGGYLRVDFGAGNTPIANRVKIYHGDTNNLLFKLQGSNDASSWINLTSSVSHPTQNVFYTTDFSNDVGYRYYQIYFLANAWYKIMEFELYSNAHIRTGNSIDTNPYSLLTNEIISNNIISNTADLGTTTISGTTPILTLVDTANGFENKFIKFDSPSGTNVGNIYHRGTQLWINSVGAMFFNSLQTTFINTAGNSSTFQLEGATGSTNDFLSYDGSLNLATYGGTLTNKTVSISAENVQKIRVNSTEIDLYGNVYVGTTGRNYFSGDITGLQFYTNQLNSTGLAWFSNNISATGYITRTSVYDKSKGSALDKIKDADELMTNGKLDDSKFFGAVTYPVIDYSKPVIVKVLKEVCNDDVKANCKMEMIDETTYPYTKLESGVDLGKEIDVLRQALYELKLETCAKDKTKWTWCNADGSVK